MTELSYLYTEHIIPSENHDITSRQALLILKFPRQLKREQVMQRSSRIVWSTHGRSSTDRRNCNQSDAIRKSRSNIFTTVADITDIGIMYALSGLKHAEHVLGLLHAIQKNRSITGIKSSGGVLTKVTNRFYNFKMV